MRKTVQSNFKPKHTIISPEDIEYNKMYTFTLNPEKQYYADGITRINKIVTELEKRLMRYLDNISYVLKPEVSKMGRIHFHGIIMFKMDKLIFYMQCIPVLIEHYTVEIDELKDYDIWYDYITKQVEMLELYNIPVGNNKILNELSVLAEKHRNEHASPLPSEVDSDYGSDDDDYD